MMNQILRIFKFGIVSALGLAIDFLLFLALLHVALSPFVANAASATAAVTFVYFASVRRVFSHRAKFMVGMFAAYLAYQAVNIVLASWAVDALGQTLTSPPLAKILILPITFSANYLFMTLLTRRGRAHGLAREPAPIGEAATLCSQSFIQPLRGPTKEELHR